MTDNKILDQALDYVRRGWAILPCRAQTILDEDGKEVAKAKAPYTENGYKDASQNEKVIRGWWGRWPNALIGVSTGPSGLLVVDLDNKHGIDGVANFTEVCAAHGGVPKTFTVRTQSGGKHLYFKRLDGVDVPSKNGWLPGVDVRADTGYIIAPPSRVVGGGAYEVEELRAIEDAPHWIIEALRNPYWSDKPKGDKKPFSGQVTPYAVAVLKGELETVATCPDGCRNDTLNTCAFRLWGWVAGGELAEDEIQDCLERAAEACGLGQVEALKTIASAKRAGMEHPRNTPNKNTVSVVGEDEPPLPLRRSPKEQAPYPTECFLSFEQALVDVSNGLNVPVSMAGNSMLGALDLLTQAIANVKTRRFSSTPLSLYLMSIAESGDGKSETENVFMKPIEQYERERQKEFQEAYRDYMADRAAYDRELDMLKKKKLARGEYGEALKELMRNEPKPPSNYLFTIADPNIEGLYKFLADGKPLVGLFTDEGARLFGGTAFSQENAQKTVGALTAVWSGKALDKMRYGDGTTKLFDRRVCSNIMMQPVIAEKLFADALLSGQGYLCRQLITWPAPMMKSSSQVSVEDLPSLKIYYAACDSLLAVPLKRDSETGGIIFDELVLSNEAHAEYDRFFDYIEAERQKEDGYAPVNGYAKRTAEQALRIAGVLTLAHNPACRVISIEYMVAGIKLSEWYLDEVLRITLDDMASPEILRAEKLLKWFVERGIELTSVRQVQCYGPGGLREKKAVEATLKTLEEHAWIVPVAGSADVWFGDKGTTKARKAWQVRLGYAVHA